MYYHYVGIISIRDGESQGRKPFTIYGVLQSVAVTLSDASLVLLDVGGNLLVDLSLDFFVFFRPCKCHCV